MRTRSIRYLPPLAISVGLTIGSQMVDIPTAYFAAGIVASILVVILLIGDVVRK